MDNKYYDGSEKTSEQKPKATKKSVAKKILKGAGTVLGLAVLVLTGKGTIDKLKGEQTFFPSLGRPLYSSGGIFGKRIVMLNDSHYCGTPCGKCGVNPNPRCNGLTSDVIGQCLNSNCEHEVWINTYLKLDQSLVGSEMTPGEKWIDGSDVQFDGYQVENVYYRLNNGKKVRAICVYHPSVGYSWNFWYNVILRKYVIETYPDRIDIKIQLLDKNV